jgi:hypothetical protein
MPWRNCPRPFGKRCFRPSLEESTPGPHSDTVTAVLPAPAIADARGAGLENR